VNTLIRYVNGSAPNSRSNSNHGLNAEKSDKDKSVSYHSYSEHFLTTSNHGDGSLREKSTHSGPRRNSTDSATMVAEMSRIPLHVRGRAEKWEIPRNQIQLSSKIGQGQGGAVFKCRWCSMDCAAKLLTQNSKESIAYYDMVNEISVISHLRHPNLVLFLGACTMGNEPLVILSEFMEGGSLEDRFAKTSNRPSIKVALSWIMDLSRAVCFLHNCTSPIIHRSVARHRDHFSRISRLASNHHILGEPQPFSAHLFGGEYAVVCMPARHRGGGQPRLAAKCAAFPGRIRISQGVLTSGISRAASPVVLAA
jgi:hypothetical protein